jgi:hypothetical protein
MKAILWFLVVLPFSNLNAQTALEDDLIGTWRAVKIYDIGARIPEKSTPYIETVQKAFLQGKFRFEADQTFALDISFPEMAIKNGHWKIDEYTNEVIIQEWKDRELHKPILMSINVLTKNGKTIFVIEETFFAFEMERDPD